MAASHSDFDPANEALSTERRDALRQGGAGLFWFCLGGWAVSALQQVFPNFLYTASLAFKIGPPDAFPLGVSDRFVRSHRVWIVRDAGGFYACWAQCPHLAGEVSLSAEGERFVCPGHGSCFDLSGRLIEGPSKKSLARCALSLDVEGRIRVDKARLSQEVSEWDKAPFYLAYKFSE